MKKTYLVAGGNGYIGSHMCEHLASCGHDVVILDNFSTSPSNPVHSYGTFVKGDISDGPLVVDLLKQYRPDCVFLFSARALVPEGEKDPLLYFRENVSKTISFLESCVTTKTKRLVFSSSCATFGMQLAPKIGEDHPQKPTNVYGTTKLMMEQAMRALAERGFLSVAALRYFNAAGCSPSGTIGENHDPETHLIPNICKAYFEGRPFEIYGDDYPTKDGTCIRDYIHVSDLARIHLVVAEYMEAHPGWMDFNIGPEAGHSIKDVIAAFERVTGKKLQMVHKPRRRGDPPALVADSSKIKGLLGVNFQYDLEDCIRHTVAWFQKQQGRK